MVYVGICETRYPKVRARHTMWDGIECTTFGASAFIKSTT